MTTLSPEERNAWRGYIKSRREAGYIDGAMPLSVMSGLLDAIELAEITVAEELGRRNMDLVAEIGRLTLALTEASDATRVQRTRALNAEAEANNQRAVAEAAERDYQRTKREHDQARYAEERVRNLHRPTAGVDPDPDPIEWCEECARISDGEAPWEDLRYPCLTIRTLDGRA